MFNNSEPCGMNLDTYFKKWETYGRQISDDGTVNAAETIPPQAIPKIEKEDLKDVRFSLGKPLTEAEFAEHRRKNGGLVVGKKAMTN